MTDDPGRSGQYQERRSLRDRATRAGVNLDIHVGTAEWHRPRFIGIKDDQLLYSTPIGSRTHSDDAMLTNFASLAVATTDLGEHVEKFAKRWGVLDLCRHGLPATHSHTSSVTSVGGERHHCEIVPVDGAFVEPLERWRYFALQARSILRAIAAVWDPSTARVGQDDWEVLRDLYPPGVIVGAAKQVGRAPKQLTDAEVERVGVVQVGKITLKLFRNDAATLAYAISKWLDLGGVRSTLQWSDQPRVNLGAETLFGAIGLRLAAVAMNGEAKTCAFCPNAYVRRRGEHADTRFCGGEECQLARWRKNAEDKRSGRARTRGPYGPRK